MIVGWCPCGYSTLFLKSALVLWSHVQGTKCTKYTGKCLRLNVWCINRLKVFIYIPQLFYFSILFYKFFTTFTIHKGHRILFYFPVLYFNLLWSDYLNKAEEISLFYTIIVIHRSVAEGNELATATYAKHPTTSFQLLFAFPFKLLIILLL